MAQILGLLLPVALVAIFWQHDRVTAWRYYIAPAVVGVVVAFGVFSADALNTPDFWVGFCAGLAGLAAAGFVLIIEGLMPLQWWTRDGSRPGAPPADQAS